VDKAALRRILDAKTALLKKLDPEADEALFSPNRLTGSGILFWPLHIPGWRIRRR
jgi:hypothetical protein